MAWTVPERAEFAALKRHALCRALGGGDVTKGLHRLLLAERRVEQYLDREHRNEPSAPRPVRGNAAAAPTRSAAATGAGMTKDAAPPRRNTAAEKRKLRSAARLQEFQAVKRQQLADTATAAHSPPLRDTATALVASGGGCAGSGRSHGAKRAADQLDPGSGSAPALPASASGSPLLSALPLTYAAALQSSPPDDATRVSPPRAPEARRSSPSPSSARDHSPPPTRPPESGAHPSIPLPQGKQPGRRLHGATGGRRSEASALPSSQA